MKKSRGGKNNKSIQSANDLRNRVRGALAELNDQRPSTKVESLIHNKRRAQFLINETLSAARENLSGKNLSEFERWADAQRSSGLGEERIGADGLVLGITSKPIVANSLKATLSLTLDALKRVEEPLYRFCKKLREINSLVYSGEYESAVHIVDLVSDC